MYLTKHIFITLVPPDILDYPTSSDQVAREGANVTLRCAAHGVPTPNVVWRREAGDLLPTSNFSDTQSKILQIPTCFKSCPKITNTCTRLLYTQLRSFNTFSLIQSGSIGVPQVGYKEWCARSILNKLDVFCLRLLIIASRYKGL